MNHNNEHLDSFTNMHDNFIRDWNEAMNSGESSSVERMTEDYYVAYFREPNEKPLFFNRDESISGMRQSVKQMLGAKKRFENRMIRLRNEDNAVVFYELLIEKENKIVARLFSIENWMFLDNKWMIVRETEEAIC
ncbi:hypothetical protein MHZ92_08525 [Sporosarcina sp. ACRSL]|uniref:hypothetical protein n=1 Tax=Sporosarcina sp. ACRSL TaxID=2918215 RepID=UPI001EF6DEA7|nr:hypothetical protein [Sporosarcina sp. ACRSL]MCG7344175.1 hypothetical protein [Sporosarcina sp. ACRSL]